MVEVIGIDQSAYKEVTCYECASKLRYLPRDKKVGTSTDYSGCSETYTYIVCPECSAEVIVKRF